MFQASDSPPLSAFCNFVRSLVPSQAFATAGGYNTCAQFEPARTIGSRDAPEKSQGSGWAQRVIPGRSRKSVGGVSERIVIAKKAGRAQKVKNICMLLDTIYTKAKRVKTIKHIRMALAAPNPEPTHWGVKGRRYSPTSKFLHMKKVDLEAMMTVKSPEGKAKQTETTSAPRVYSAHLFTDSFRYRSF